MENSGCWFRLMACPIHFVRAQGGNWRREVKYRCRGPAKASMKIGIIRCSRQPGFLTTGDKSARRAAIAGLAPTSAKSVCLTYNYTSRLSARAPARVHFTSRSIGMRNEG